jgi:hypothetical protein
MCSEAVYLGAQEVWKIFEKSLAMDQNNGYYKTKSNKPNIKWPMLFFWVIYQVIHVS